MDVIQKDIVRSNRLFTKNGMFSKTSTILVCAWGIALFKYIFQGCILTIPKIGIYWAIIFTSGDALAITGAASALYFAVHNMKINVGTNNQPKETGNKQ